MQNYNLLLKYRIKSLVSALTYTAMSTQLWSTDDKLEIKLGRPEPIMAEDIPVADRSDNTLKAASRRTHVAE